MGCIYMYTNKINNMKYIGQTVCKLSKRHWEHLNRDSSYIDRALRKYGESNFTLEVLEDNIDEKDLDSKEIFYIEKYNTFEDGYNLTRGGGSGTRIPDELVNSIKFELKNTKESYEKIKSKLNCSMDLICDINLGHSYTSPEETYPLREVKSSAKYSTEQFKLVVDLIKDTSYSFRKISELTQTNYYYVCDVNRGRVSMNYGDVNIPIRKYTVEKPVIDKSTAQLIIDKLKNEDKSAEEIALMFDLPAYTVGQINRGKLSICREITAEIFPIRKDSHRNRQSAQNLVAKLTKEQVLEIAELLLNTTETIDEISKRYLVNRATIDRINRKVTWKNILVNYTVPIRTNP